MGRGPEEITEFPKWVEGVVVKSAVEEAAVVEGRAVFGELKSAQGDTRWVESITPKAAPKAAAKPAPEPAPEPETDTRGLLEKAADHFKAPAKAKPTTRHK